MLHFADRPDAVFTAIITQALVTWDSLLHRYPWAAAPTRGHDELETLALRHSKPIRRLCRTVEPTLFVQNLLRLHTRPRVVFAVSDVYWMLLDHALRHFSACHRVRTTRSGPQPVGIFRVGPIHDAILFEQYFSGRGFCKLQEDGGDPTRPLPPIFAKFLTGRPADVRDFCVLRLESPGWSHPLETPEYRGGTFPDFPPGPTVRHTLVNGLPVVSAPLAFPAQALGERSC
jgi:hypothetical protein